jgi:hypothetical protein
VGLANPSHGYRLGEFPASDGPPAQAAREGGVKPRVMFDTGALIALERRHLRICKIHRMAAAAGFDVVAPTPVIAEWWRDGRGEKERRRLLRRCCRSHRTGTSPVWPEAR